MRSNLLLTKLTNRLLATFAFALIFFATVLTAQQPATVSGKVTSSVDGLGLPGVTVLIKGTQTGAVTDLSGNYRLEVPGNNAVLVFSFIGFETQEVTVGNQRVIDLVLLESAQELEEVVVTALGITREEKSLGFSVGSVDGENLNRVAQENVINSLAGKVSGVTVNSTGGTGSSVSMVIRGASSLSSDNQPLFVIDGVPVINTLNNTTQFGNRNIVDYGNATVFKQATQSKCTFLIVDNIEQNFIKT